MRVYIWFPAGSQVGHASLQLSNGRYISWWPPEDKGYKDSKSGSKKCKKSKSTSGSSPGSCHESLQDDINEEGRQPSTNINLDALDLNEEEIEDWWIEWRSSGSYFLVGTNCCWVVYQALRAGGAPVSLNPVWSPSILYRYLTRITEGVLPMLGSFFRTLPI